MISNADLAEKLGLSEATVARRLNDLNITGGAGADRTSRGEQAKELLAESGIEFLDGDTDTTSEDDSDGPDLAPRQGMDPDDVPVQSLEPGDGIENTEVGGWYEGRVDGVKNYGLFVTLAAGTEGPKSDFSGLAHESEIPSLFIPQDYEVGDWVVVERLGDGDKGKPSLRMCTDPDGDWIVDGPLLAPADAQEDAGGSADQADSQPHEPDSDRVRAERGSTAYEGPADGLDLTTQSITERPVQGDPTDSTTDGTEADSDAETGHKYSTDAGPTVVATLELDRADLKALIREGPDRLADRALDALLDDR